MHRNHYFFKVLIILLFFNLTKGVYSQDNLIQDLIDPYCQANDIDEFSQDRKIKNIEIVTNNKKKWIINTLGTIVEFYSDESKDNRNINSITKIGINWFDFRIDEKYKKNFKSTLVVNFEGKLSCKFKAKIRITGDLWWHIDWKNGRPLTSVQVELLDGHINSITRFKLFLPKARNGKNEIFVTSLLSELGFLAPRTFMVSADINGVSEEYIFQEDLRKELLENSKLVEGPILEGDERFTIRFKDDDMMPSLSLSRIINRNYSLRGETNEKIALSAVSNLNLIYLQHHQSKFPGNDKNLKTLFINTDKFFIDDLNRERLQTFDSLMYALDALAALSYDDRRFYFDPIHRHYVPIYYDGKPHIMNKKGQFGLEYLSEKSATDAKAGATNAIKLINNINHDIFKRKLSKLEIKLSSQDYDKLIQKIIARLEVIKIAKPNSVQYLKVKKYFSSINPNIIENKKLIFVNYNKKEFYLCSFNLDKCEIEKLDKSKRDLANILSQRFTRPNKNFTDTEYLFVSDDINYDKDKIENQKIWNISEIKNQFIIKYNNDIKVETDSQNKKIKIEQTSNAGRAIITDGKLDGWSVTFEGSANIINKIPKDYLGLTGCLTLLDVEVIGVNLSSKNSFCEDSINFIRVKGDLETVTILDSISDALDIDFSHININQVKIENAKNDCLDLSYGNYLINKINVKNCGDKGISVGEKSNAIFKEVKIDHSNIAVAAKDTSFVEIGNSEIFHSPICFSAYRKKQEFAGAKIKITETNCNNKQLFVQEGSKIILGI